MTALELLAWLPAVIWIYLILFRGRFWLPYGRGVRLPPQPEPMADWPSVAVVIPARNEVAILGHTLPTVQAQRYPGPAHIYLVDDSSDDGTGDLARAAADRGTPARQPTAGLPLAVVGGAERPPGWVGKTWALQQGVSAALERGDPEWLLFTDADIAHPPGSLSGLVAHAVNQGHDVVSLMARLRVKTAWEKLIVPAFVYFFSQLYPFRQIPRRRSRTAGAAGGCLLVRTAALARAGGVSAIAGAVIDDVALGRAVKRSGGSVWLGYADGVSSLRPYPRLGDLWDMIARSAYTQLRHSKLALAGTVSGLAVIYLAPPVLTVAGAAAGSTDVAVAGATAWALLTLSYLPMAVYYRIRPWWAVTLPAAAALYGAMTVDSARRHWRGAGSAWKGRTYSSTNG